MAPVDFELSLHVRPARLPGECLVSLALVVEFYKQLVNQETSSLSLESFCIMWSLDRSCPSLTPCRDASPMILI